MRRSALLSAVLFAIAVVDNYAGESKLPDPPKGFAWKRVDEIKASFLMPAGWHFRLDKQGNTTAIFITQEKIEKDKPFQTGLAVNVIRARKDISAEDLAKKWTENVAKMMKVSKSWKINQGKFKGNGCLVTGSLNPKRPQFTMYVLALANTTTNTFYIIQFESLEKSWDEAWKKKGEPMMKLFALDDEV